MFVTPDTDAYCEKIAIQSTCTQLNLFHHSMRRHDASRTTRSYPGRAGTGMCRRDLLARRRRAHFRRLRRRY